MIKSDFSFKKKEAFYHTPKAVRNHSGRFSSLIFLDAEVGGSSCPAPTHPCKPQGGERGFLVWSGRDLHHGSLSVQQGPHWMGGGCSISLRRFPFMCIRFENLGPQAWREWAEENRRSLGSFSVPGIGFNSFVCIHLFESHNNPMRRDYCHCHFLGKEPESQSHLPKTAHLVSSRATK